MSAWIDSAVIDVDLAVRTSETYLTRARIPVQPVGTHATMLARIRATFIDINLASFSCTKNRKSEHCRSPY